MELDLTDKKILNILQTDFPISERPFETIGSRLNISESEVIGRIIALKQNKVIRQISAIFDSHNIGYKSTLVSFKVPEIAVDFAADVISGHKGVSHNYLRDNLFNIWFTITLPPEADLEEEIKLLAKSSQADDFLILPTLKLFKIGVNFDMTGDDNLPFNFFSHDDFKKDSEISINDFERDCIRELQKDLDIIPEPFKDSSSRLGISEGELLNIISQFIDEKKMRRFACVLYHQKAGFSCNIMSIWKSKEEEIEKNGKLMSDIKEVSHCYQRPVYPGKWEYNIFTMIHARSEEEAYSIMKMVADITGIKDYKALKSIKEFKKVRVKYYI